MNLVTLGDEIAALLKTVTGLSRVTAYPPPTVQPPCAIVSYPSTVEFDQTYGRGSDRIDQWPIVIVEGRVTSRTARSRVLGWAAATGAKSIKATFEAHHWVACDDLVIKSVTFDVVEIAGADYIAAIFAASAVGKGTS